jgi:hypothetical protein
MRRFTPGEFETARNSLSERLQSAEQRRDEPELRELIKETYNVLLRLAQCVPPVNHPIRATHDLLVYEIQLLSWSIMVAAESIQPTMFSMD